MAAEQVAAEQAAAERNALGNMPPTMAIASTNHAPTGAVSPTYATYNTSNSAENSYATYRVKDGEWKPGAAQEYASFSPLPRTREFDPSDPVDNMGETLWVLTGD